MQSGFAGRAGCSARQWCMGLDISNPSRDWVTFSLPLVGRKHRLIIIANDTRIEEKGGQIKSEHGHNGSDENKTYLLPCDLGMSAALDEHFLPVLVNF